MSPQLLFLHKGDQCCNRRLRNADYAPCIPFYTGKRGWGLKAVQPITAGAFVVEYVGEVIDEGMCRDRLQRYHEEGRQSFYILSLAKGLYIDAAAKANKARWAGHAALGGWARHVVQTDLVHMYVRLCVCCCTA